jgi:tRNA-splicing ligase RtcB
MEYRCRPWGAPTRRAGWGSLAEEAPIAYKDVAEVVEVCLKAGLYGKVARMRPLGVFRG